MFVVTVMFEIETGQEVRFTELVRAQAENSLAREEDCHQFDVCVDPEDPCRIFLYELYTNKAAFQVHLNSDHFVQFDADCAGLIASKSVTTLTRIYP